VKPPRSALGIVFITVFLDLLGFGILIPIQPFYAESFGARPAVVTLLSASFSVVQFLFAPFLGRLSDSLGRRRIMLLTIAVNALGYALFGLARNLPMLFAARMISGFGSANLGTAQAIIADVTTKETRAKGMGLVGAAFGLGFIFGPAIGGFFGQLGLNVPAYVASGLAALNWIFAFFKLPETRRLENPKAGPEPSRARLGLSWSALQEALGRATVPQLLWLYLVGTIAFSLMEQVLGLYIERTYAPAALGAESSPDHLRQAAALTAYFLVLVGITAALVQGVFIGRLVKYFGERRLVQMGTFLMAVSLALIPVVGNLKVFAIFMALGPVLALATGFTNPSLPSLLSQAVEPGLFGGTLGLGQSLSALGRIVGPSAAGLLFELHHGIPFWVGAVLMVTCTAVALTLRPPPEPEVSS
jgi:MFS family permease